MVEELAGHKRLVLICGRYEGVDQRVIDLLQPDEISIGDYILGGGEVAAMVVIDAVVRLVPGVLGDEESNKQDSFSGEPPLLEFAQYTRPREYRGLAVPEVLMTGNHPEIARWREEQKLERTRERRADLLSEENRTTKTRRTRRQIQTNEQEDFAALSLCPLCLRGESNNSNRY